MKSVQICSISIQAYLDYMVDVAKFLGAETEFARLEMLDVLKFEMQLANISLPREERRNATRYRFNEFNL